MSVPLWGLFVSRFACWIAQVVKGLLKQSLGSEANPFDVQLKPHVLVLWWCLKLLMLVRGGRLSVRFTQRAELLTQLEGVAINEVHHIREIPDELNGPQVGGWLPGRGGLHPSTPEEEVSATSIDWTWGFGLRGSMLLTMGDGAGQLQGADLTSTI